MSTQNQKQVTVVLKGYPRLSETFIAQELLGLQHMGYDLRFVSLRHPTDKTTHPIHQEITAPVSYLPEYLYQEPIRVLRGVLSAFKRPGFGKALRQWWQDLLRDPTPNRIRRFGQACVMAHELPDNTGLIYAHFIHTPGSVAYYTSMLTGMPWSASAHAKDIWTIPEWEKSEKLANVQWLATCTGANREHLAHLSNDPDKVHLVYHGLDLQRFAPEDTCGCGEDHHHKTPDNAPVTILSVGRLVAKKGYPTLLSALAELPKNSNWRFVHIGGGNKEALEDQAEELGIAKRIEWRGALSQVDVLTQYRQSDVFVLASRITEDGDRDGLPNVLMEAQSQYLPVIATAVSAIPEFITHGENGWLVPPNDANALALALNECISDPVARKRMGAAGRKRVTDDFSHEVGLAQLSALFPADVLPKQVKNNTSTTKPERGAA